jgi:hypothetical protein
VGVVLGILLLAAGVPLLVPSWVLERMQTPPAPKAEPPRPPEEAPARPREESAKDSGPLELPHAPE